MADLNEVKLEALLEIINSSTRQAIAEYKKTGHGVPGADSTTFHPLDVATDTVGLRKAIRLLESACHQLTATLAPPQHTMMNFVDNGKLAYIDVALRARIADVLDQYKEGLSVDKLAEMVNLDKSKIARVLRALSLIGCFKEVDQDVFANTRLSLILKSTNNVGCYIRGSAMQLSKPAAVLYEAMTDPEFGISHDLSKTPRVFALRKDGVEDDFWDMINNDDELTDIFGRSMIGHTESSGALAVLHHYPWDNVSSVVDVGSGICAFSIPLAKMYPNIRITNQDLPATITLAQKEWEKHAPEVLLDGRVELAPLQFLEEPPVAGKDVYYMKNILHDWPDAEAITILRNVRKAMKSNSVVLVHEYAFAVQGTQQPRVDTNGLSIAPKPLPPHFGAGIYRAYQEDMSMWLLYNSKERTLDELKVIGAAAGLAFSRAYDLVQTMVVEFKIAED